MTGSSDVLREGAFLIRQGVGGGAVRCPAIPANRVVAAFVAAGGLVMLDPQPMSILLEI
jgi:hypothetical protein